jgi:AraC-like DNA-binding protein
MLGMKVRFRKIDFVHFILFFLVLSYYVYLGLHPVERIHFFNELYAGNGNVLVLNIIFGYAQLIQFFVYLFASIRLVRKSIINEKNYFSDEGKTKARWLLELLIVLFLLDLVCMLLYLVIDKHVEVFYIPLMYNLFYGYIVYQSFRYASIFNQVGFIEYQKQVEPFLVSSENGSKSIANNKYSLLDKQKFDAYADRIISHFETNKPYLDPELNITKLSEQLAIPVHYISAVINEKMNKSFFDFVNNYRIEEVKLHLQNKEYEKFSLEAIGNNCGFNSRTSFFRVFKKHTGKTPKDYLKTL